MLLGKGNDSMKQYKIIIEKSTDGYVAYPLGLKGIVVGQGDTYDEALSDVKSASHFHIESFGEDVVKEAKMRLKVDKENDALYFRLDESGIVESEEVQPGVVLDFNAAGKVVGIEILNLSVLVTPDQLSIFQYETA